MSAEPAAASAPLPLRVAGLRHAYQHGSPPAVEIDALDVPAGTTVALTGPSGFGRTTLAYLLSGIERVRDGSVRLGSTDLATLSESARERWRRRHAGFVFQGFPPDRRPLDRYVMRYQKPCEFGAGGMGADRACY